MAGGIGDRVTLSMGTLHGTRYVGQLMSLILQTSGMSGLDPLLFVYYSPQVVTAVVSQGLGISGETCTLVGETADLQAFQAGTRLLFLGRSDLAIVGAWDFPELIVEYGCEEVSSPAIAIPGTSQILIIDRPPPLGSTAEDAVGYTSRPRWIAPNDVTATAISSLVKNEWGMPLDTITEVYVQHSLGINMSAVIKACEHLGCSEINVCSQSGLHALGTMKNLMETEPCGRWLIISERADGGCLITLNTGREAFKR